MKVRWGEKKLAVGEKTKDKRKKIKGESFLTPKSPKGDLSFVDN
jgi:hypothetical protein